MCDICLQFSQYDAVVTESALLLVGIGETTGGRAVLTIALYARLAISARLYVFMSVSVVFQSAGKSHTLCSHLDFRRLA